jgi:RHS repeat-associated protein
MKINGSTKFSQNRSSTRANAISGITANSGTAWAAPAYHLAGNMTTIPQPASLNNSYGGVYDAWNRLVKLTSGVSTIATYAYDGLHRRATKTTTFTRHFYYSSSWQCLEERLGTSNCVERQFVWGLRYLDDLVVRDVQTGGGSSSSSCAATNQRFYVLHDYFNVAGITNTSGTVQERYGYDAFGASRTMDASFGSRSSSLYGWETRYGAYRWDSESGLYYVRRRYLNSQMGIWTTRDPIESINLYLYIDGNPINNVDVYGEVALWITITVGTCVFLLLYELFKPAPPMVAPGGPNPNHNHPDIST